MRDLILQSLGILLLLALLGKLRLPLTRRRSDRPKKIAAAAARVPTAWLWALAPPAPPPLISMMIVNLLLQNSGVLLLRTPLDVLRIQTVTEARNTASSTTTTAAAASSAMPRLRSLLSASRLWRSSCCCSSAWAYSICCRRRISTPIVTTEWTSTTTSTSTAASRSNVHLLFACTDPPVPRISLLPLPRLRLPIPTSTTTTTTASKHISSSASTASVLLVSHVLTIPPRPPLLIPLVIRDLLLEHRRVLLLLPPLGILLATSTTIARQNRRIALKTPLLRRRLPPLPAARASLPQLRLLPLSLLLLQRSRVLGLLAPLRLVLSIPVLNLRRRLAHGAPAAASTALLITILAVAPLAFQLLLLERLGIFHLLTPLRLLFTAPTERITPLLRRRRLTPTL